MRSIAVFSFALVFVLGACASLGAEPPVPQPRGFVMPSSCQLANPDSRANGSSWSVTCASDASIVVGNALVASGWRNCGGDQAAALFRKDDLITTISPQHQSRAQLIQASRGDECP
jgi:hypothetical protein